ncbi:hypothetical protein RIF29_13894 [Crotalaria pallida]|uniref:Uncharacterized protein n=1 Tax=Crotalaria pallida TaxID=3830 RepID=A0AAN9FCD0_CROPI
MMANNNLESLILEREKYLQTQQSIAFSLANYYFVFQGVILTIVLNHSLKCSHRWLLFTVSLIAALLNLMALFVILLDYTRKLEGQDINRDQASDNLAEAITEAHQPPNLQPPHVQQHPKPYKVDLPTKVKRYFLLVSCMALLLGFAVVTLIAIWHFPCADD